jgi:hypothetical protein
VRSFAALPIACVALACASLWAQPAPVPLKLTAPVQDKNFYLLSMLERTAAVSDAVKNDPALARMAAERLTALDKASNTCALDLDCYAATFEWSDAQASEAGHALGALYRSSPAMRSLADGQLRSSGMYVRYAKAEGETLLEQAWADCVHGMNHMIDVYELGKATPLSGDRFDHVRRQNRCIQAHNSESDGGDERRPREHEIFLLARAAIRP